MKDFGYPPTQKRPFTVSRIGAAPTWPPAPRAVLRPSAPPMFGDTNVAPAPAQAAPPQGSASAAGSAQASGDAVLTRPRAGIAAHPLGQFVRDARPPTGRGRRAARPQAGRGAQGLLRLSDLPRFSVLKSPRSLAEDRRFELRNHVWGRGCSQTGKDYRAPLATIPGPCPKTSVQQFCPIATVAG